MLLPLLCLVAAITLPPPSSTNFADGAALLTDDERATVVEQFQTIKKERAVTVGLITIDQLDDDPKAVAVRTLNYWQMGPDSVLLLISLQPRKIYLQPGTNLQYLFDNHNSSAITNSMVPFMKKKDTLGALLVALRVIDSTLMTVGQQAIVPTSKPSTKTIVVTREIPTEEVSGEPSHIGTAFLIFALATGLILAIGIAISRSKKRRYAALDDDGDGLSGLVMGPVSTRPQTTYVPPAHLAPVYDQQANVSATVVTPRRQRQYSPPPVAPVVQQTVIVESNPLPPVVIVEAPVPAPSQTYSPPPAPRYSPPAPRYSPPSYSSDSGGGSSWGSDSGGSSDGGGGGGSDW